MYKIIILQETATWKFILFFHKNDRKSINPDVLFYAGQAWSPGEGEWRLATAVLIGAAIYYGWHVWQLLRKMPQGYQAGDLAVTQWDTNPFLETDMRFVVVKKHFSATLHEL